MRFMVPIVFKASSRLKDIAPHVAAEQARVAALTREGTIVGVHLSTDRRRGWRVMAGRARVVSPGPRCGPATAWLFGHVLRFARRAAGTP